MKTKVYILQQAENPQKKFQIIPISPEGPVIQFGQAGANDFTITRDFQARESYLKRHRPREDWMNPQTAGFWSAWLLWNKPTLEEAINDTEKRFGLRIVNAVES
jgi:hypothetical protein